MGLASKQRVKEAAHEIPVGRTIKVYCRNCRGLGLVDDSVVSSLTWPVRLQGVETMCLLETILFVDVTESVASFMELGCSGGSMLLVNGATFVFF